MTIRPYKVILKKKKAFIIDDEGIEYMEFKPHPDGDPEITKEGVEIILDNLKIPRLEKWVSDPYGNSVLFLSIEMKI